MSASARALVIAAIIGGALLVFGARRMLAETPAPPVVQPIAFSHATHVKGEELECVDCHAGARKEVHAGFPDIRECHECHSEAQGKHPEEPKVREYAKQGAQIPWVPVNHNPGHVYFSHRAHVTAARMKCEECHGKVEELVDPPARPRPELHSMAVCVDCHRQREASLECVACHQ
jgi:hypothetical protein